MKCPFCGEPDSKVTDTRAIDEGSVIRRRRLCEVCGGRFVTYERMDIIPLTVIKRGGLRETFDKNKILTGIRRSCEKRSITVEQMEQVVSEIESYCINSGKKEIESEEIGEMVMEKLKAIDEVAYVRFASVYRQFKDIDTFMAELSKLLSEKKL